MYIDDVIIVGKSFHEHLRNLQEVFQRLREAGLTQAIQVHLLSVISEISRTCYFSRGSNG